MLRTIIIEDEPQNRKALVNYLRDYCQEVLIISTADSVQQGIKEICKASPDVVFLDIELPDGNAFDLLDQLGTVDFETIFVTAYDEYALQAINDGPCCHYLLKPFEIEEL